MASAAAITSAEMLLVEDNPSDVRLMQEALKRGPFCVNLTVARDGVEALKILRDPFSKKPDLIILDLNLPRMNGREVLAEVKSDPKLRSIPVLVMTTSRADHDIEKAYHLNANCYLAKPLDLDEFLRIVHSVEEFWLGTATLPPTRANERNVESVTSSEVPPVKHPALLQHGQREPDSVAGSASRIR